MKYICTNTHFQGRHYIRESVHEFADPPENPYWECLEVNQEADFGGDSKEVLMEKTFKLADLKDFVSVNFGVALKGKLSKEQAIDKLVYARENHVEPETAVVSPAVEQ